MTTKGRWILASASPRRQEILSGLGLKFKIDPSEAPEPPRNPHEPPSGYAIRAARIKVQEAAQRNPHGLIIGADTIVVAGDCILGKPSTIEEARTMLCRISGRWHEVITGLCLSDVENHRLRSKHCSSRVHFKRLTRAEIDWYISKGEYKDKAGAYGIQGYASVFIDRIEGCYFNIVGFPVFTFSQLCKQMGLRASMGSIPI